MPEVIEEEGIHLVEDFLDPSEPDLEILMRLLRRLWDRIPNLGGLGLEGIDGLRQAPAHLQ